MRNIYSNNQHVKPIRNHWMMAVYSAFLLWALKMHFTKSLILPVTHKFLQVLFSTPKHALSNIYTLQWMH